MSGVIFITSYTANLVAFLTYQHNRDRSIDSFQDLEVQRNEFTIGTIKGGSVEQYIENSLEQISKKIKSERMNVMSYEELYRNVANEKNKRFAIIDEADVLDRHLYTLRKNKTIENQIFEGKFYIPEKSRIGKVEYAFAVQKGSIVGNAIMARMAEFVTLNSSVLSDIVGQGKIGVEEASLGSGSTSQPLQFGQLGGVFKILFSLPLVCTIILAVEWATACTLDIDKTDPNSPQNFDEAFKLRIARMWLEGINQDRFFGYYLFKLLPGWVSSTEFHSKLVLSQCEMKQASRRIEFKRTAEFAADAMTMSDNRRSSRMLSRMNQGSRQSGIDDGRGPGGPSGRQSSRQSILRNSRQNRESRVSVIRESRSLNAERQVSIEFPKRRGAINQDDVMLDFSTSIENSPSSASNPRYISKFAEFNYNLTKISKREKDIIAKKSNFGQRRGSLQMLAGNMFEETGHSSRNSEVESTFSDPKKSRKSQNELIKYQLNPEFDDLLTKNASSFGFTMDDGFGEKLHVNKPKLKRNRSETDLYSNRKLSDAYFWTENE